MSSPPSMRRADKAMTPEQASALLARGRSGRLAVTGDGGWPYAVPMLYVTDGDEVLLHVARADGHLRRSLARDARACLVVDEPGDVYPYGRFQCDTALAYASVMVFGHVVERDDAAARRRFFDALMAKYSPDAAGRPAGFYPRLDRIVLLALVPARTTGKLTVLPAVDQRWPAADRTASPGVLGPPDAAG